MQQLIQYNKRTSKCCNSKQHNKIKTRWNHFLVVI